MELTLDQANTGNSNLISAINSNLNSSNEIDLSIQDLVNQIANSTNSADINVLRSQIYDLQVQRNGLNSTRQNLSNQMSENLYIAYLSAQSLNNSITTTEDYESNQKMVNQLMLTKMLSSDWSFSESERAIVLNIANQCPLYGGEGVYRARSLAAIWSLNRYEDNEICIQALSQRSKSTIIIPNLIIEMYPNPVTDLLTFTSSIENIKLETVELMNVDGKIINIDDVIKPASELTISTSGLINGIYLTRLKLSDGQVINKKFIKI